jgi:cytoskeletal protein CcmA (bactofilin family)
MNRTWPMAPDTMQTIPAALTVRGEIEVANDLAVAGDVRGAIWADQRVVTVSEGGSVTGDIIAGDVTVRGSFRGTILASAVVEIAASGEVEGRIIAPRLILREGGSLNGSVQPQRVEAAFRVAQHRRQSAL